jgi:hypothetical protein
MKTKKYAESVTIESTAATKNYAMNLLKKKVVLESISSKEKRKFWMKRIPYMSWKSGIIFSTNFHRCVPWHYTPSLYYFCCEGFPNPIPQEKPHTYQGMVCNEIY